MRGAWDWWRAKVFEARGSENGEWWTATVCGSRRRKVMNGDGVWWTVTAYDEWRRRVMNGEWEWRVRTESDFELVMRLMNNEREERDSGLSESKLQRERRGKSKVKRGKTIFENAPSEFVFYILFSLSWFAGVL
jgi:translation initiation factor IF-1